MVLRVPRSALCDSKAVTALALSVGGSMVGCVSLGVEAV